MRTWISVILFAVLWLGAAGFALAQETEEPAADAHSDLDIWLQAEALNRRCQVLNYFETRAIAEHIAAIPEDLSARREMAAEAVAERECSPQDADIVYARRIYVRALLKSLLASNQSEAMSEDRAGRKMAALELMGFTQRFYGRNYDSGTVYLFMELDEEGADPEAIWSTFYPTVDDIHWQLRLEEKGWKYNVHSTAPDAYVAIKMDEETVFPARLGPRQEVSILDADGAALGINAAHGVMDDGRIVVLLSKDLAESGPAAFKGTLFVQEDPSADLWAQDNWRASALRFEAEALDDEACPADTCLVLPQAASDLVAARAAEHPGFDAYELVIGAAAAFPLEMTQAADLRTRFNPPAVSVANRFSRVIGVASS